MTDSTRTGPGPGWYPDPATHAGDPARGERWWDGSAWTPHVRPSTPPRAEPVPAAEPVPTAEEAFARMALATAAIRVVDPVVAVAPVGAETRRRRRGAVVALVGVGLAVVAGGAAVLALDPWGSASAPAATSTVTPYSVEVEDAILASVAASEVGEPASVDCPDDLTPASATAFTCDVAFPGGDVLVVEAALDPATGTIAWTRVD